MECMDETDNQKQPVFDLEVDDLMTQESNNGAGEYYHALRRESLWQFILADELPFSFAESPAFIALMRTAMPHWQETDKATVEDCCISFYEQEKEKLKDVFKSVKRINITTEMAVAYKRKAEMFTLSDQEIEYMIVKGHWIDSSWKSNMRVLSIFDLPVPYSGDAIADALSNCFVDWGIEDKIGTITVNNSEANNVYLSNLSCLKKALPIDRRLFHVRCFAHFLKLLAVDALKPIETIVDKIRNCMGYVLVGLRYTKFCEIATELQLTQDKLTLDVRDHWGSTYKMIQVGIHYKQAFSEFASQDRRILNFVPTEKNWVKVEQICTFLEVLYDVAKVIYASGSEYPTSNQFLCEIWRVKQMIENKMVDESSYIRDLAKVMKKKFNKYWYDCGVAMLVGACLDQRFKLKIPTECFEIVQPEGEDAKGEVTLLQIVLQKLFQVYVNEVAKTEEQDGRECALSVGLSDCPSDVSETELSIFLIEEVLSDGDCSYDTFDAMAWWKENSFRFPILSKMVRDVLAIPITTVAGQSTINAGSRVIKRHYPHLSPYGRQASICGANWVRELDGWKKQK